jgi:RHS repeat-associated protein
VTHTNGSFSGESFSYDANGNRTMSGYGTDTGNRLDDDGAYTYEYDDEGNLITRTETASGAYREFDYDHRNRLTSVTDKTSGGSVTGQVTYTYDALDRRIEVDDGTDVLRVAYDGQAVILDFDGSNNQTARYLPGPMIDELLARETGGGTVAWYLQDRLNTVRDLADNTGAIINHIDYDAFGAVIAESAPSVGDRFKFTGRELDAATGLQFNRARYYDAAVGRWTQEDPIGFKAGDANLYRYVGNGTTNAIDPLGLFWIGVGTGGGSGDPNPSDFEPDFPQVDDSGRCHDPMPDKVPTSWTKETVERALEAMEQSKNQRDHNDQRFGNNKGHDVRNSGEEKWRQKLRDRLRKLEQEEKYSFFGIDRWGLYGMACRTMWNSSPMMDAYKDWENWDRNHRRPYPPLFPPVPPFGGGKRGPVIIVY